jgi:hypothetical protein
VIVAHFYDIESVAKTLPARAQRPAPPGGPSRSRATHPRAITEAEDPTSRWFAAVICEQIDRIARRTYFGTLIEHRLHAAGVALADEPIRLPRRHRRARPTVDPTNILTAGSNKAWPSGMRRT